MVDKKLGCSGCKAWCCRAVAVEIDAPTTKEDFDDIKWKVAHKNVIVYKDNDSDWLVEFHADCGHLDENWQCKVYDGRYKMCREHDIESCVVHGEGEIGTVIFTKPEDVDKYLEKRFRRNGNGKK
jgi:Fe-S-cluster containining protein